jgi:microcystin degradation protein MlrC
LAQFIAQSIRPIVGPDVPVGVGLDNLHCDLTDELVAAPTAIVIFRGYPCRERYRPIGRCLELRL